MTSDKYLVPPTRRVSRGSSKYSPARTKDAGYLSGSSRAQGAASGRNTSKVPNGQPKPAQRGRNEFSRIKSPSKTQW